MSNNRGGRGGGKGENNNRSSRKESILELAKLVDSTVLVKCSGGRELRGTLRGYDELVNLVLDDCDEFLRGKNSFHRILSNANKIIIRMMRLCIALFIFVLINICFLKFK